MKKTRKGVSLGRKNWGGKEGKVRTEGDKRGDDDEEKRKKNKTPDS